MASIYEYERLKEGLQEAIKNGDFIKAWKLLIVATKQAIALERPDLLIETDKIKFILYVEDAKNEYRNKHLEVAEKWFLKAEKLLDSSDFELTEEERINFLMHRAFNAYYLKKIDICIPLWEDVLASTYQHDAAIHDCLSHCYYIKKDYEHAFNHLLNYLKLEPDDFVSNLRLAYLYYITHQYQQALDACIKTAQLSEAQEEYSLPDFPPEESELSTLCGILLYFDNPAKEKHKFISFSIASLEESLQEHPNQEAADLCLEKLFEEKEKRENAA